ncbi:MAG: methyltransferase domain-containing protein, partial [Thalassolituus sp.]
MATLQTRVQDTRSRRSDHQQLMEAATRYYTEADRTDDVRLLKKSGQLAFQAWQANSSFIPGINLLARIAMRQGKFDEAQHWLNEGLALRPESTGLLYSAGHLALTEGDIDRAEHYFAEASRISRVSTKAPLYLAHIRLLKGEYLEAFQLYRELVKTNANDSQVRNKLFEAASYIVADFYSQELEEELLRWFDFDDVDHSQLRSLSTSLLQHKLRLSEAGCPLEAEDIANDPLLNKALTSLYFCDPVIERLLMTMRQSILISSSRSLAINSDYLPFVIALATQCELNEAVWYITPDEQALVSQLNQLTSKVLSLETIEAADVSALLLLTMMYQPLRRAPFFEQLCARSLTWSPQLQPLMELALAQPQQLQQLAQNIPSFGISSDQISDRVREQYEQHPYPRWNSLGYNQPSDYYASLQALFPGKLDDLETPRNGVSVLVAGCGTGRHALRLARYFNQMQVTAIDLSLTSLAYALWQAEKYRLNIDFIQGDILRAEMLGQTYDVIESSGVLHHMLVPEQGLNALIERLRPGGVMKLALYSRQARTLVRELRDELSGQIPETDAEIRTVREVLLQNQDQRWSAVLQSS